MKKTRRKKSSNSILVSFIVVIIIISSFALLYSIKSIFTLSKDPLIGKNSISNDQMGKKLSKMSLTLFDIQLAKEFMDKDNDGKCDACGMPVEICISSGQLQCNMDSKSTIGILGSQHIHADWKIYINGKEFDWSPYADRHERQMKGDKSILDTSAFIHIHPAQASEKAGDVLHMHAAGVPLWIFFKSLGIELPNNVKLYINGKLNPEGLKYAFRDLDKMLIIDEAGSTVIQQQLNSITELAGTH